MDFKRYLKQVVYYEEANKDKNNPANLLKEVESWQRQVGQVNPTAASQHKDEDYEPVSLSPTLDLYRHLIVPPTPIKPDQKPNLLEKLLGGEHRQALLPSLTNILNSPKADASVTEEILDLMGYEEMDLVFEIVKNRQSIGQALKHMLDEEPSTSATASKGARRQKIEDIDDGRVKFTPAEAKKRMVDSLDMAANRPLFTSKAAAAPPTYPHVYTSSSSHGNVLSSLGSKFLLPIGTTREETKEYEEVTIPPAKPVPPKITERPILIPELDDFASGSFPGYSTLNRIQSIIYPTAYGSNENLLICAPTGAGKTDVAMLTILRVLDQHRNQAAEHLAQTIRRDDFKIIYVAPMKALASEIVRKLSKRLAWLSIKVRELTGDMQMTRAEIAETQIIVTTPEKWDVVTRKPTGEGELASKVKLLIIDEVHLLNEERGAVIETIVARTLRQVESTQSVIRIVGLSATLPNYIDVADFLRVSRQTGLFYFDSSFRPVPLEQHFIGVKGKLGTQAQRKNLDQVTYDKVSALVAEGHQVMVFVHARKETVKSALMLKEMILAEGATDQFDPSEHPHWEFFRREISASPNKEMKQLFDFGFGIHHAGMLRSDRNMMERMFEAKAIKVLFCTATLAWGVNLPAHAVLIKGTEVYDSSKGAFVNLSVLDVLQIFGRAGRPGMETSGVGFLCTPDEKLDHYLNAVTSQHAIESKFIAGMVDSLNAEVSLGTVTNVTEAVQWLGYTYLFVRMKRNPLIYGMPHSEPSEDPQLGNKRLQLVTAAARQLAKADMLKFNESTGELTITDLGRIAAKYYIRHTSIEIFNKEFKPKMSEADVLAVLSMSTEFDQIQVRENELPELKVMMDEVIPCQVRGGTDTSQGKVNILLQGYISQAYVEDFALVSDTAYAAQNGGRIIRALLEIAISRKWASTGAILMAMSKAVEKRMWPYEHPLKQFGLKREVLYNIEQWADDLEVSEFSAKSADEIGRLIHLNPIHGAAVLKAAKQFPAATIDYVLRPLTRELLKIIVSLKRNFEWNQKVHGSLESFWIWVEDESGVEILQWTHVTLRPTTDTVRLEFIVPVRGSDPPSHFTIRLISDRWIGADDEVKVPLSGLIMPEMSSHRTRMLDVPFLAFKVLSSPDLESRYSARYSSFNGMQTQCFWTLHNSYRNVMIAAPTASGKTLLAHLAIWRTCVKDRFKKPLALVISHTKSNARDFAASLRPFVSDVLDVDMKFHPDEIFRHTFKPTVRVTTSACLATRMKRARPSTAPNLSLIICDDLESLDDEYELGVSLLIHATQSRSVRIVGLASPLYDASDLARWLHVPNEGLFTFHPSDREQPLVTATQSFTIPHSAALFKAMAKPAHAALRSTPASDSAIVFVPARVLCRSIAGDLITQCAIEMQIRGFLGDDVDEERMALAAARLQDQSLADPLVHGIGVYHEGLSRSDQTLILELYAEGIVRVLVTPRECCWSLPVRGNTVVVMGTQYWRLDTEGADRQIMNYSIHELSRMQSRGIQHGKVGRFHLFCQAEDRDTFTRFLDQGLPLESELLESERLAEWLRSRVRDQIVRSKQDAMDVLSFTFLALRIEKNPGYYGAQLDKQGDLISRYLDDIWPSSHTTML